MNDDELRMQFELVRQSIGTWAAETAELVGAASQARQTGVPDADHVASAQRRLEAVRAERQSLAAAVASLAPQPDDLARGIEIALNELDLLEQDNARALAQLQA